jgi:catechol 2,3-dioxygenase-like lactoylglutathione lyase family enzyme
VNGPIVGLDHVQVAAPAGCEDEARRFYGALLGLEEIAKPPLLEARGGVWFSVGAQELHVGVADPFAAATKAHPALQVSSSGELERLASHLDANGVGVRWADLREMPGTSRFFVDDPWGNRLELVARQVDP